MAQHRLPSCRLSPADVPAPCRSHPSQSRRCASLGRPRIASCSSQIPWLKTADYADFAIHQNTTPIEKLDGSAERRSHLRSPTSATKYLQNQTISYYMCSMNMPGLT